MIRQILKWMPIVDNKDYCLEIKEIEKLLMSTQTKNKRKILLELKLNPQNIHKLFCMTIILEEKIE